MSSRAAAKLSAAQSSVRLPSLDHPQWLDQDEHEVDEDPSLAIKDEQPDIAAAAEAEPVVDDEDEAVEIVDDESDAVMAETEDAEDPAAEVEAEDEAEEEGAEREELLSIADRYVQS